MKNILPLIACLMTLFISTPTLSAVTTVHLLDAGITSDHARLPGPSSRNTLVTSTDTIPITPTTDFGVLFTVEKTEATPPTPLLVEVRVDRPVTSEKRATDCWFFPVLSGQTILVPYTASATDWPPVLFPGAWHFHILTEGVLRASKTIQLVAASSTKPASPQEKKDTRPATTPKSPATPGPKERKASYFVQVGAFSKRKNAVEMVEELRQQGISACLLRHTRPDEYIFVTVGEFQTEAEAVERMNQYQQRWHTDALVKKIEPEQYRDCP